MKILIVLIRMEGGVGRVVLAQKKELEKRGHKVKIISREDDLNCMNGFTGLFKIQHAVRLEEHDILYSQDWSCGLAMLFAKNHYINFHGVNPNKFWRVLQRLVGKLKGKKIFVVGDKLKETYPKAILLYNAVDRKEFYDLGLKRDKIGWIKKETEELGYDDFVNLYGGYEGLDLEIADGVPPEEMNEWYNQLKIFVSVPTNSAGFNLCWLEAKASGVPQIVGNENGIGITKIKEDFDIFTWENNVDVLEEVFNNEL